MRVPVRLSFGGLVRVPVRVSLSVLVCAPVRVSLCVLVRAPVRVVRVPVGQYVFQYVSFCVSQSLF